MFFSFRAIITKILVYLVLILWQNLFSKFNWISLSSTCPNFKYHKKGEPFQIYKTRTYLTFYRRNSRSSDIFILTIPISLTLQSLLFQNQTTSPSFSIKVSKYYFFRHMIWATWIHNPTLFYIQNHYYLCTNTFITIFVWGNHNLKRITFALSFSTILLEVTGFVTTRTFKLRLIKNLGHRLRIWLGTLLCLISSNIIIFSWDT